MENTDTCKPQSSHRVSELVAALRLEEAYIDSDYANDRRGEILGRLAAQIENGERMRAELESWRSAARKMQIALGADAPLFTPEATLLLVRSRAMHFSNLKMVMGTALAIIASEHSWVSESVAKTSPDGNTLRDVARKAAEYARQPVPDPFTNQATPGWYNLAEDARVRREQGDVIVDLDRTDEAHAIRREDMQKRIFEKFFKDKPPYTEEELKGCGEILPQTPNPTGRGY